MIKICPVCGFVYHGRATHDAHTATHNARYSCVVGVCPICKKNAEFYGTNATKARGVGNLVGWVCDDCQKTLAGKDGGE